MTENETDRGFTGFVQGLARLFHTPREEAETPDQAALTPYQQTARELDDALQRLKSRVEARRQAATSPTRQAVAGTGAPSGEDASVSSAERERLLREQTHAAIRRDILAVHERLGTGIADEELDELRDFLETAEAVMSGKAGDDLDHRIRSAVLRRIYDETGPVAWSTLNQLMTEAGVDWPISDEPVSETTRRRKVAEIQELMVNAGPAYLRDLIVGIVAVWDEHYPEKGSPLWNEVALRGAGAGIRCRSMKRAVEFAQTQAQEVKAEVVRMLSGELDSVQSVLARGVSSLEDADQLVAGTTRMFDELIPELIWERVEPIVHEGLKS